MIDKKLVEDYKREFYVESGVLRYKGRKPATQRAAFLISLAKWEKLLKLAQAWKLTEDGGTDTCGLCARYYAKACRGCPIWAETGKTECNDTPFQDYYWVAVRKDYAAIIAICRAELALLRRLYAEREKQW